MKKIYNKQTILYILLFLLIFILGILLIKYLASKKETFLMGSDPFTEGITSPTPNPVGILAGPPHTFISCYNPTNLVIPLYSRNQDTNSTLFEAPNSISISFLYHSTGSSNSWLTLFRLSRRGVVDGALFSRCPALFIHPTGDNVSNYLHFRTYGASTLSSTSAADAWNYGPWTNEFEKANFKLMYKQTYLITFVI